MQGLSQRILTAIIIIATFTATYLYLGTFSLFVLAICFLFVGIWEYQSICFHNKDERLLKYWNLLLGAEILWVTAYRPERALLSWALATACTLSVLIWIHRNESSTELVLKRIKYSTLGLVYCGLMPAFGTALLLQEGGLSWFGFLLVVVPAGDIFAYFGGILWGKRKLAPALSPKKTIVGSFCGTLGAIVLGLVYASFFLKHIPLYYVGFWALAVSLFAQTGDLFESLIKRVHNVKDSGKLLPGHGGVLDRLDGFYFASPLVYAAHFYSATLFAST